MTALGLTLLLFFAWGVVGLAMLNTLGSRRNLLRNVLLAPSAGSAVFILCAFWWNRLGFGQKPFAPWLAGGLLLLSAFLFWRRRTPFPLLRTLPFALVVLGACLLTGFPMTRYGLDWISVGNEDMTNYVLSAQYYSEKGRTAGPDVTVLQHATDMVEYSYFVQHSSSTRFGSELMLALTHGVTRISTLRIFMPVMLALHLALVSAVGGMVMWRRRRWAALLACGLAAIFPLMTFGVTNQLIAQVFGLGLTATCATLLLDCWRVCGWREILLAAVMLSALALTYPELSPVLGLATALWFGIHWLRRQWQKPALMRLLLGGAGALVLLNFYVVDLAVFLLRQGGEAVGGKNEIMPFFLLPSAGLHIWGLLPLTAFDKHPHLLALGLAGMCLTLAALATAIWQARRNYPPALLLLSLATAAMVIVGERSGFGAFKLASYVQPFLAAVVAAGWFPKHLSRAVRYTWIHLAFGLGALGGAIWFEVPTTWGIVRDSTGERAAAVNIAHASQMHLAAELERMSKTLRTSAAASVSSNPSLLKLQGLFLRGIPFAMPAMSLYTGDGPVYKIHKDRFDYGDGTPPAEFYHDVRVPEAAIRNGVMLVSMPALTVLNRSHFAGRHDAVFEVIPHHDVENLLTFVATNRSRVWMDSAKHLVGLFQVEADPFGVNQSMSAVGRYLLLRVDNPVPNSRLVMDLTTLNRYGEDRELPDPIVIGENRTTMEFEGSGAGRLVSGPITPRVIDGVSYIGVDMGTRGAPPAVRSKSPLMQLWGEDLAVDSRPRIVMARNISLVRDDELQQLPVPRQVSDFPADLYEPSLDYSGISEDGCLGARAELWLRATEPASPLTVRGYSNGPQDGGASRVTVRVDGRAVGTRDIPKGDFAWQFDAQAPAGIRQVELEFDRVKRLSYIDGRMVSVRLDCAGFGSEACLDIPDDVVLTPGPVLLGRGWSGLEGPVMERYRVATSEGCTELRVTTESGASYQVEAEPLPGSSKQKMTLDLLAEGKKLGETTLDQRKTVNFPLPVGLHGGTEVCLAAETPAGQKVPFRAYSIVGPESAQRAAESGDVVEWPIHVLSGWYPIEKWEGETFRWITTDAAIYVPRNKHRLVMEIEPGLGLAGKPLRAQLVDRRGRVIAQFGATKRGVVTLDLPQGTQGRLMFRVLNKGVLYGIDPRILNFRVFWLRAE